VQRQGAACLTQLISAQEREQLHQARHARESFRSTARKLPAELLLPRLKPCTANARPVSILHMDKTMHASLHTSNTKWCLRSCACTQFLNNTLEQPSTTFLLHIAFAMPARFKCLLRVSTRIKCLLHVSTACVY